MRTADMTWMDVEAWLEVDDRCVLPLGSTEQHAYLSLEVDHILSERVAAEAAAPLGIPVFPGLPYGVTPYFMAYPGTVTLSPGAYERVLHDILESLVEHGFQRIAVVNGHGGNREARPAAREWAEARGVKLLWHDWWSAPRTMEAVKAIDPDASHASWMEGFPWTRVEGARPPEGHKAAVDLKDRVKLSPRELRERLGDGSFGGYWERPDEELLAIWEVAVTETRERLKEGWR